VSGRDGSFVKVNVAGIDDALFADTLFGHRKGAFSGASSDRDGLVLKAANGTLFLDEIGDLDKMSQVKLLRLIQEGEYLPLGCDIARKTNARIVTATNADLEKKVADETFRKDLFYRLDSYTVTVPPLRERLDDIPLLLDFFLAKICGREPVPEYNPELVELLRKYDYPGNVRELEHMVEKALAVKKGETLPISPFRDYIVKKMTGDGMPNKGGAEQEPKISYSGKFPPLDAVEDYFITEALSLTSENIVKAAKLLHVSRFVLQRKLKKKK
jgi:transcriptional regulator with PAS, ATPase and Fis domain